VLSQLIDKSGVLDSAPRVKVEIPPRGIIFANGSTVVHQVVYGNRTVALEGAMPDSSLYLKDGSEWANLENWIVEAGYSIAGQRESA
jgi:hypothetical protein